MNEPLKRVAKFARDLLVINEQSIRVGRQNFSREDLESEIIGVDMLGQFRRVSSLETFDGDTEQLDLGAVWRGAVTLDFYGSNAYTRAITFSLTMRSQVALDLMKSLAVNIHQPTGPTDLKQLTGQQYGERVQIEMTVEISQSVTIDTLYIDTAQVTVVDDIVTPVYQWEDPTPTPPPVIPQYTLTYLAGAGGTISGDAVQVVSQGTDGTEVTAAPDTGYEFTTWDDGVLTAARIDLNVMADITVTASFVNALNEWVQIGTSLSITGANISTIAVLNSTDVAFISKLVDQLQTYRWDGSTWSQIGSGLSITIDDTASIALTTLNSTDVALIDSISDQLRTYRWNGSTWSLVGTGLSIPGTGIPALAALNSTDVAFISKLVDQLRTYRWNGSTWSLVGTGLSILGVGFPALAALNSTDVALIDESTEQLRTYRWNGSTWSLVGTGLSILGVGFPALAALNSTDVALIDAVNEQLRTYRWNGSTWSLVGTGLSILGTGVPALAALNSTDVAFYDAVNEQLRTYRWQ